MAPSDNRELDFDVPTAARTPKFPFKTIESKDVQDAVNVSSLMQLAMMKFRRPL
jgi:hypothetical protein